MLPTRINLDIGRERTLLPLLCRSPTQHNARKRFVFCFFFNGKKAAQEESAGRARDLSLLRPAVPTRHNPPMDNFPTQKGKRRYERGRWLHPRLRRFLRPTVRSVPPAQLLFPKKCKGAKATFHPERSPTQTSSLPEGMWMHKKPPINSLSHTIRFFCLFRSHAV